MDVVAKTKSSINALIDVDQFWIDTTPTHDLTEAQLEAMEKKLKKAKKNIEELLRYLEEKKW